MTGHERGTDFERAIETSKKVANVIQHLITQENIVNVTQEAKTRNERYICLSVGVGLDNLNLNGNNEAVY